MDGFILFICNLLSYIVNPLICGLFVFEFFFFFVIRGILSSTYHKLNKLSKKNVINKDITIAGKKHKKRIGLEVNDDWDDFIEIDDKYGKDMKLYTVFSMIIQLFTLLGILGTVAGLFIALQGMDDLTNSEILLGGVKFALSSTVYGLIAAIISKVLDIILVSFYVNVIDDGIRQFEENYKVEHSAATGKESDQ